jgi:hypothetical protein
MLRNRSDFWSVGGVINVGMFLREEYAGGGEAGRAAPSCEGALGVGGASRVGNAGGGCNASRCDDRGAG